MQEDTFKKLQHLMARRKALLDLLDLTQTPGMARAKDFTDNQLADEDAAIMARALILAGGCVVSDQITAISKDIEALGLELKL
jgi:hypothetical protein